MHQRPIAIAIVGCGAIARAHADILAAHPYATLQLACDADRERLATFSDHYQIPHSTIDIETVAVSAVDAVYICTPHHIRLPLIEPLARAGKRIFCEKPLTHDADSLRALHHILQAHPCLFWSGYKLRYYSLIQRAVEVVPTPELIHAQVLDDPWPAHMTQPNVGGGNLRAQGVYAAELIRLLAKATPVGVTAVAKAGRHGSDVPDRLCATFDFASGAIATITVGDAATLPPPVSKFYACSAGHGHSASLTHRFCQLDLHDTTTGMDTRITATEDGFRRQTDAFLAACQGRGGQVPDFRSGAISSILIDRALHAAETRQYTHIDIDSSLT